MRALLLISGLGLAAAALLPAHEAKAWWDGYGRWSPVPYYAPPQVLLPPAAYYAPRAYGRWIPPHYDGWGRYIPGHWA